MDELLLVLGLGVVGALLWSSRVRPRLQPLATDDSEPLLLALYVVAVLVNASMLTLLVGDSDIEAASLRQLMVVQAAANGTAVIALVFGAWMLLTHGVASLGIRRHAGPPALLTAVAAWMLFVPFLSLAQVLNDLLLDLLGVPHEPQRNLELFVNEGGADSAAVWIAMVVVIPVCEELLMRGALYGGLRRILSPATAMVASALVFALLHEPAAALPVGLLGLFLAWLYERTGSLTVPCLVHGLQNGITLLLSIHPEPVT